MNTAGSWLRRSAPAPAWPRSAPPGPAPAGFRADGAPSAFPASVCEPCAPPVAGNDRPRAIRAAPSAFAPHRRLQLPPAFRRRCRRRPCCRGPVPRPVAAHPAELSGRRGHGTFFGVVASLPRRAPAEVHGLCQWGGWPKPCPRPSLAACASPKCGAFPTPSCVVSTILGTMPHSDSLRTAPAFGFGLIPVPASAAVDLAVGCGRVSPVDQPAFTACRLTYAGEVPGCSRIQSPDCCLRPIVRGSTLSVPHGWFFRRGRVHVHYGLQLRASSLRRRVLTRRRKICFPAPLAACGGGTHTRRSIGPSSGHATI